MAEGRDYECRKGQVHQVSKRNGRYVNDAQTSSNRGIERAEDAAATRSSTTRQVASEFSRKIFTCALVLVVACSRLAVKSHEGDSSSSPDSNVTEAVEPRTEGQKPHEQSQPANQQQICLVYQNHRIGRGNRYLCNNIRVEGGGGGTCVRVRRVSKSHRHIDGQMLYHRSLTWICVETKIDQTRCWALQTFSENDLLSCT